MRWLFYLTVLFSSFLLETSQAVSIGGNRLLVILEELGEKSKYSKLWEDLSDRGYQLSFESPRNEKLSLFRHGERAFDHVILLPPKSKGLGPSFTPVNLLNFLNSDGNILLTLSSSSPTPSAISSLLLELDIHLPPERTSQVIDHFHYDELSASDKHDVLVLPRPSTLRKDVKNFFNGKGLEDEVIAFPRTVGHVLGNDSPLLAPIIRAPDTAYIYNPRDDAETTEEPFATGQQISLVSALQARNSARFVVLGSAEMLEDTWLEGQVRSSIDKVKTAKEQSTANRAFAKELTAWAFKEVGVLKVGRVAHHAATSDEKTSGNDTLLAGAELSPNIYRVKSDVTFSIELSEYKYDHFEPFIPPPGDSVQLEFTMLSPYHRLNLKPAASTPNSTIYSTTFTLPDQHGIFTFRVNYKRPFLTWVDEKRTVTVRHFAHDEWPRSWRISGAWVWIAGIWSTVAAWLIFVAVWLWSAPPKTAANTKKMQ
ncbi:MAG: hypothetical protein M1816_006607 [Peltula sp. TS41687]|nr:MAG: hypothetical protein M1816_006607 [Peltula sp. TS41687]